MMKAYFKDIPVIYLKPGDICLSVKPCIIETILGSCVSVTMWHKEFRIGGMCHALLPHCRDKDYCANPCKQCGRFVKCSVRQMIRGFKSLKIRESDLEVKIFGGAETMSCGPEVGSRVSVGRLNVLSTLAFLESRGLLVKASDTGGRHGRKLFFNTTTGEVYLKRFSRKSMSPDVTAKRA